MSSIIEDRDDTATACPCCSTEIGKCPFCGKRGCIILPYENAVFCEDDNDCGAEMNFGHWCGEEKGIPAIHHVIAQWNKREVT